MYTLYTREFLFVFLYVSGPDKGCLCTLLLTWYGWLRYVNALRRWAFSVFEFFAVSVTAQIVLAVLFVLSCDVAPLSSGGIPGKRCLALLSGENSGNVCPDGCASVKCFGDSSGRARNAHRRMWPMGFMPRYAGRGNSRRVKQLQCTAPCWTLPLLEWLHRSWLAAYSASPCCL